jgi:hypothetical protein
MHPRRHPAAPRLLALTSYSDSSSVAVAAVVGRVAGAAELVTRGEGVRALWARP